MVLRRLNILNFKNIASADIEFREGVNCFVGNNGAGKTNILDAIYFLSMTKSAFGLSDIHCVKRGGDFFMLSGEYGDNPDELTKVVCSYKERKVIKKDGKEYEKLRDHVGLVPVVFSTPSDVVLISDSPEERRKFLNASISQSDSDHLTALVQYNRLLAERNKALKGGSEFREYIRILDMRIPDIATAIFKSRREYVARIAPTASRIYARISGENETVGIEYQSDLLINSAEDCLAKNSDRDTLLGYTTGGVHRDDIALSLNGVPIRKFGSQGQQKTMLLALKLAQAEILGKGAILLLDDIFDKLDTKRVANLLETVSEMKFCQIFVTDSNKVRVGEYLGDCRIFNVKEGEITE